MKSIFKKYILFLLLCCAITACTQQGRYIYCPDPASPLLAERIDFEDLQQLFFENAKKTIFYSVHPLDKYYLLYPEQLVREKISSLPPYRLYWPETSDCDNRAEHYSYWLHLMLPGAPVLSISGIDNGDDNGHRWCIVMTKEHTIIEIGGRAELCDILYDGVI